MKKTAALLILLLVTLPLTPTSHASTDEGVDCQFLLIMADQVLKQATSNTSKALEMALDLYNISLPPELGDPHREFYDTIIELLYTLNNLDNGDPWSVIHNLTSVYGGLQQSYQRYASKLASCGGDPQVTATVRVSGGLTITRTLLPMVKHIIEGLMEEESINDLVNITLGGSEFIPGERIEIRVDLDSLEFENVALGVVEWPTLTPFQYLQAVRENNTLTAWFTTPSASKLKSLPLYAYLRRNKQLSLAVIVSGIWDGRRVIAYRVFNVTYRVPQLQIETPQTIPPGRNVTFTIVSDGLYTNVSIGANGVPLFNTTLYPGSNNYTFNPADYGLQHEDIIVLSVRVPPGDTYLGTERSKPIIVTTTPQGVMIRSNGVIVTWTGKATVEVDVNTTTPVIVEAGVGPLRLYESSVGGGNNTVSFPASILPITPITITVSTGDEGLKTSMHVLVVNPAYTTLVVILVLVIMASVSSLEGFIWIPLKMPRAGTRQKPRLEGRGRSLVYRRIESRVAEVYYRSLLRLKQSLPSPSQTLREHYSTLKLPGRVRETLWRLLRLAEEDLYSKRKPAYEQALELLRRLFRR